MSAPPTVIQKGRSLEQRHLHEKRNGLLLRLKFLGSLMYLLHCVQYDGAGVGNAHFDALLPDNVRDCTVRWYRWHHSSV